MGFLESGLKRVAVIQHKFAIPIIIIILIITLILGFGITKIGMESDISKEMPQDMDIYQLNNKITDKFSGQDTTILIFSLDESIDYKNAPKDIRDPLMVNYLAILQQELLTESLIDEVGSIATYTSQINFQNLDQVKYTLKQTPELDVFFSKDYKTTIMFVKADVGSSDKKVIALSELINNKIEGLSLPTGIKVMQTGTPQLRISIVDLLAKDAVFTLLLAAVIILVLLFILEKSFTKGLLVFSPLTLGLIWTIGTLGWSNIKLSIATVGLGAMILGLGVEYGTFVLTRYKEERDKGQTQLEALKIAVPGVGSAILGSGATTLIGFLALTLSIMPMMQHLGVSLALGIFYSLFAAVFIAPVIIILEEQFEYKNTKKKHISITNKKRKQEVKKL